MVTTEQIKELRDRTGISIIQCKKALEEVDGNMDKALEALKAQGAAIADKKSSRTLAAGKVSAYIHSNGNMGCMVELHSETDFVAKNPEFIALADDLAMHIAAMNPANQAELMEQPFIKEPSLTVKDLIQKYVQKFGERIELVHYVRFDTSVSAE
jgi:elongation factor Ts